MALQTSPEHPAPVRVIANAIAGYVDRLGAVWVEGQVAQVSRRQGMSTVFLTFRDPVADVSISVTCSRQLFDSLNPPLVEGASVVLHAKPSYYANRGTLSLYATDIRMVGLVTAPESAAERDVLDNARRRWPGARFKLAYAAMQGSNAARDVIDQVERLDRDRDVEVIVIARGGGSIEDLLPFSDEGLVRAVHKSRTVVVSAIGHEPDTPLLDLVADVRASTPTDAAKLVVPDVAEELQRITLLRDRGRAHLRSFIDHEFRQLESLRQRPALSDPGSGIAAQYDEVSHLVERSRRAVEHRLARAEDDVGHHLARVRALSPLATLRRGYAVLQDADGQVVTSIDQTEPGARLHARVADGRIDVDVDRTERQ